MKINQITNAISKYDAVSNQIIEIKNVLCELGHESKIYVKYKDQNVKDNAITILNEKTTESKKIPQESSLFESDIVILHHFNKSLLFDTFKTINCKKILYYHNITPPSFFMKYDKELANQQKIGLQQLLNFKDICHMGIGSKYNQIQLQKLGFKKTFEIPYYVDEKLYGIKNERPFSDNKIYDNFLFVGRISPNKKYEDILKIFYYYSNLINPNSRLFFTGKIDLNNPDLYQRQLLILIKKLNLENKVIFTGLVDFEELLHLYRIADVFISMSEHEGFGVPLIESMIMKVPIIAYDSAAIPYTLNGTGVLIKEKDHKSIVNLISQIIKNKDLNSKITSNQLNYFKNYYNFNNFKNSLLEIIKLSKND